MRSFRNQPSNRRAVYLDLVGSIEGQLRDAYAKRHARGLDTQASVAAKLGVHRSAVNRRLTSQTNMRLDTVADMAWALGQSVVVKIFDPAETPTNAPHVRSEHAAPTFDSRNLDPVPLPAPALALSPRRSFTAPLSWQTQLETVPA